MIVSLIKLSICPNCGSTQYLTNYPAAGQRTCAKCSRRIIEIELKPIHYSDEISDSCFFCGKEGEEDDLLCEEEDVLVFKCKQCKVLDGYKFVEDKGGSWDDFDGADEGSFSGKDVKIAKDEGSYVLSAAKCKELAKALKKEEKDPKGKCEHQILFLTRKYRDELEKAGASNQLIQNATIKAQGYIRQKGALTEKQLKNLLCASLYVINDKAEKYKIPKANLTERTLQEIFGTDRKTIRKWKETLKHENPKTN